MNAATTEAADLIKNSFSTAIKGLQDYNNKVIEFTHLNTNTAFDFVQKMSSAFGVFRTLGRTCTQQVEKLTEQTKQLAALAQKVSLATAEPLKMGVAEAFNRAA